MPNTLHPFFIRSSRSLLLGSSLLFLGLTACAPSYKTVDTSAGRTTNIIGGTEVSTEHEFARTIAAVYNVETGALCTSSILSNELVITAAHCVGPLNGEGAAKTVDLRVVFGLNLRSKDVTVRGARAYTYHPAWDSGQDDFADEGDIALVRFSGGLPQNYKPATLLTDLQLLQNGREVAIAGYGMSDAIKRTGSGLLRHTTTTIKSTQFAMTEILLDQTKGQGACHGDSGGPAYVQVGDKYYLWGITSRGVNDSNDTCSRYAAFTNILAHGKWVLAAIDALMKVGESSPSQTQIALNF